MSKHAQCKYCKWNANVSTENGSWDFFPCLSGFETPNDRKKCLRMQANLRKKKQTFFL